VFLNILSMAALAVFAWYLTERLRSIPKWLVWGWLMTTPWTIEMSTHILNPSFLLAPALAFFIAFFEAVPAFSLGKISRPVAFAIMGAGVAWMLQIHMSWPLLIPYAAFAWIAGRRSGVRGMATTALCFAGGLLLVGALVIPTFLVYGFNTGSGGTLRNLRPHFVNPAVAVATLARFFSFASLEIWRFMATDDGKRVMFLARHVWIAPLALVVWAVGIWQPIWMLREWFRTRSPFAEWRPLKWLVVGTVLLVYASFWFVIEPPQAHNLYVIAPIALLFAAYCWTFVDSPRWRRIAAGVLAVNVAYHIGQAWIQAPDKSLYRNRSVVATAIRLKQPEIFAHRRPFAIDGGALVLQDPTRPYDSLRDVKFEDIRLTLGPRRVALWTLTLHNRNERVAFRDVLYLTRYRDDSGQVLLERSDYVKDVFQPKTETAIEVNDGFVEPRFASATIEVMGAEALLPIQD
jgi:hypothetical protein